MNLFRTPTPQEIRQRHLVEAETELLEASRLAEYYAAMQAMLARRIDRLRYELTEAQQRHQDSP